MLAASATGLRAQAESGTAERTGNPYAVARLSARAEKRLAGWHRAADHDIAEQQRGMGEIAAGERAAGLGCKVLETIE